LNAKPQDRRAFLGVIAGLAASACGPEGKPRIPSVIWAGGGGKTQERVTEQFRSHGFRASENLSLAFPDIHPGTGPMAPVDETRLAELVRSRPDVFVLPGSPHVVMGLTRDIPIVFYNFSWDPEALGFVKSLRRPGGNVTGATLRQADITLKQWQLMKEIRPAMRIGGFVADSERLEAMLRWWGASNFKVWTDQQRAIGDALKIEIRQVDFPKEASSAQIAEAVARSGAEALMVDLGDYTPAWMDFVARARVPTCGFGFGRVEKGLFMIGWSFDSLECERQAVAMVARILRGESPGEIPVYVVTKLAFALNRPMAQRAGIDIPGSVLVQVERLFDA
jgi:putative ABC transport system substrate-binding protein